MARAAAVVFGRGGDDGEVVGVGSTVFKLRHCARPNCGQ